MEEKDTLRKISAGLFFIASVVIIGVIIFSIGKERGFTEPKFQIAVLYRDVGGLSSGAPVTLSGVHVGTVGEISFVNPETDGRGVKVMLNIYERYKPQLHKSTAFLIKTEGVLGEKIVDIVTAPDSHREDLEQPVIGIDPLDVQTLATTFGAAAQSLLETSKTIDTVAQELQKISGTTTRLLNRIEQRIIDGNLFKVF